MTPARRVDGLNHRNVSGWFARDLRNQPLRLRQPSIDAWAELGRLGEELLILPQAPSRL